MRLSTLLLFLFLCFDLSAQQELMLQSAPELWHSNATNPAFFPQEKRLVIGLPAYALDAAHSGNLSLNDIYAKRNGIRYIDFSEAIDKLDPENTVHFDQRIETVSIGLRLSKKWALQAGHANRFTGAVTYPKDLPALLWNGNAPYIGKTLNIGPKIALFNWNEWSVGAMRSFGNLTIGAKLKILTGVSALESDENHHKAEIYTNPDIYQLTLNTDYAFNSSSIISAFDTAGYGFRVSLGSINGKAFTANTGIAYDFGFNWQLTKRIRVSASVLDWKGKINWTEKANYYKSNGTYEYEGAVFPGTDIINGGDSLDFDSKIDTLNDIFKFVKTPKEFSTSLPTRYYASFSFMLNARWTFGASFYKQSGAQTHSAIGFSARWSPIKWATIGAMYSVDDRSVANIGMQFILKPGPFQLYLMSDNLANVFTPRNTPALNIRAGASLVF
jgi:hypothetical protein